MGKPGSRSESSTKAGRKFGKKLEFYAKVRDAVSSLGAQKAIVKVRISNSSTFALFDEIPMLFRYYDRSYCEFLPELKEKRPTPASELKINCKSKKKLVLKEGKQLTTVLNHPTFKSNHLAAIHQHLQSTQPVVDVKPVKRKNKSGSKKRKEKKSKASVGPQAMDM
ncbi:hypothetical protein C1H46_020491 [Malus baccata]|uniref:Uncharacterized protein n=1 Tax=Malus baccata TaxID=106549 RepID=A0A540M547_MALBA|nr:hypothetical protein C1H46_020491 [Malus baccata]